MPSKLQGKRVSGKPGKDLCQVAKTSGEMKLFDDLFPTSLNSSLEPSFGEPNYIKDYVNIRCEARGNYINS